MSRKQIADAATPAYIKEAEALIIEGTADKDRATRQRTFEKALQVLLAGIGERRRSLADCLALAEVYWELTQSSESIANLKEAIQLAPKDARPYALLGRYLMYKGLRDQALNFLDRAIQLDPDDHATRKIRDRAALNKKKAYTVVVNAADVGLAMPAPEKKGAIAQHKAQATRLIEIGKLDQATDELAKAEHGDNNTIDKAIATLFGGNLLNLDASLLRSSADKAATGGIVRVALSLIFVTILGLAAGLAIQRVLPESGGDGKGASARLVRSDRASQLEQAILNYEEKYNRTLVVDALLAHVLLVSDHGADITHVDSAATIVAELSADERSKPRALLARVLLQRVAPDDVKDESLEGDLAAASKAEDGAASDPFLILALAEWAAHRGQTETYERHLHRAALVEDAPPRALHQLARLYARKGQYETALNFLRRLWKDEPHHGLSLATGVAVAALANAPAATSEESGEKKAEEAKDGNADNDGKEAASPQRRTATEDEVLAVLDGDIPDVDAAAAAVMIALFAQARGDDILKDRQLGRVAGVEGRGPASAYPGILETMVNIRVLEFDPKDALKLLRYGEGLVDREVRLQKLQTRAEVLGGLGEDLRGIKLHSARPTLKPRQIILPGGRVGFDFAAPFLPIDVDFDPRYFPEAAMQVALEMKGISPSVAKRKLRNVADIKLAQIALSQDDTTAAGERLNRARGAAESDPEFHLTEALVKSREGDSVAARRSIEEALDIAPDEPRFIVAASRIYLSSGNTKAAEEQLERLSREGFMSPSAYAVLAQVKIESKKLDEAKAAIEKGQSFGGQDPELAMAEMLLADASGDFGAARKHAEELLLLSENTARAVAERDARAGAYVFDILAERGERDAAIDALRNTVARHPRVSAAQYVLGRLLAMSNSEEDRELAVRRLREAVRNGGAGADLAAKAIAKLEGAE